MIYRAKLGNDAEAAILLAQDPADPTKYVPVKAVDNGDGTYSIRSVTTLSGSITPTHTEASVGASTTAVLAANANRKYALIINDSTSVVYLKIGGDAEANKGIRLNASGGSYEMSAALGNLATGAINGISDGAGKNVIVTEGE